MFYSYHLLSLKKGKFGLVWLAATRGDKYLTKKDIGPVDLTATCAEIMNYVSCNKKDRLSLYLSAQLTIGVCRVYRKKATFILTELQELLCKSLRAFQPDLMISLQKKGHRKVNEEKARQRADHSFSSRIDLHPTNEVPQTGEEFGMLVLPFGIDPPELRRGELPYYQDYIESQLQVTVDSITDSNQARPEDITMREDELSARVVLNYEAAGVADRSDVIAAGGQGADELQNLPPMNLEFFQPVTGAQEEEIRTSKERKSRRISVPEESFSVSRSGGEPASKQMRLDSSGDGPPPRRQSQRLSRRTIQVTAEVHPQPVEMEQQAVEARDISDTTLIQQGQLQESIALFEDAQPTGFRTEEQSLTNLILNDSIVPTQTEVVKETPEDQLRRKRPADQTSERPENVYDIPASTSAVEATATVAQDAVPTETRREDEGVQQEREMSSSLERLLRENAPVSVAPRGRRTTRRRQRRPDRLIIDQVTALTRDEIRGQLISNGQGLLRDMPFVPARVLPPADWLISHAGGKHLGKHLQRFWCERQILCAQGPPYHEQERRQLPHEDARTITDQSTLSEVERRRGESSGRSMMQSLIGVSDVSILQATAGTSGLGDTILATSGLQQGEVAQVAKTSVEEVPVQQQQQEQQEQQQEQLAQQQVADVQLEREQQQQMELERIMEQPPPPPPPPEPQIQSTEQKEPDKVVEPLIPEQQQQLVQDVPATVFEEENDVWRRLVAFDKDKVMWSELCPKFSTNKKDAAKAFVAILEFCKKNRVALNQCALFGDIEILISRR